MTWPKEPKRGIRYTPPGVYDTSGVAINEPGRMVVLSATYSDDRSMTPRERWCVRSLRLSRRPNGGRHRVVYITSWPPYEGCVPGWPEDAPVDVTECVQLDLLGSAS